MLKLFSLLDFQSPGGSTIYTDSCQLLIFTDMKSSMVVWSSVQLCFTYGRSVRHWSRRQSFSIASSWIEKVLWTDRAEFSKRSISLSTWGSSMELIYLLRAFESRWMGGPASRMPNGESIGGDEQVGSAQSLTSSIWILDMAVWVHSLNLVAKFLNSLTLNIAITGRWCRQFQNPCYVRSVLSHLAMQESNLTSGQVLHLVSSIFLLPTWLSTFRMHGFIFIIFWLRFYSWSCAEEMQYRRCDWMNLSEAFPHLVAHQIISLQSASSWWHL